MRVERMKHLLVALALLVACSAQATLPMPGEPGAINDPRYCGEPERTKEGKIKRSRVLLRNFAKVFPCPSTLAATPSCVGWAIDHVIPLADGGCDAQINLQWLPDTIKSCAGHECKDRWERIYHGWPRKAIPKENQNGG